MSHTCPILADIGDRKTAQTGASTHWGEFVKRRRQRGTQIVELAIVIPLLAFIVFAVIEGSEFARAHNVLNNAAREGARLIVQSNNLCGTLPTPCVYTANLTAACNASGAFPAEIRNAMCTYIQTENAARPASAKINTANVSVVITQTQMASGVTGVNMPVGIVQVSYPYPYTFLKKFTSTPITLRSKAQFRQFN